MRTLASGCHAAMLPPEATAAREDSAVRTGAAEAAARTLASGIQWPAAALMTIAAAFILAKAGRDALYFQRDGLLDLPWAYIGIAALSMPLSVITLGAMRVFGARHTTRYAPFCMMLVQSAFWPLLAPGGGWRMTLFFMLIPLGYGILFSLAWLHAAEFTDRLSETERAWTYGLLGAMPMVGGLMGAVLAKAAADTVEPQWFTVASSSALAATVVVIAIGQQKARRGWERECEGQPEPPTAAAGRMPLGGEAVSVLRNPYIRRMFAAAVLATAVGVLVEFQFYAAASGLADSAPAMSNLFANFYLALNGAALLIQVFVTPTVQTRIGVGGNLMILPTVLLSGSAVLAMSASGLVRAALRVAEGGLKSSVHRSSWEQAYLLLPRSERQTAKVLIDAMAVHLAEGTTALFLLLGLWRSANFAAGGITAWLVFSLLLVSVSWVLVSLSLRGRLERPRAREDGEGKKLPVFPDCCVATAVLGDELRRSEVRAAGTPREAPVRT